MTRAWPVFAGILCALLGTAQAVRLGGKPATLAIPPDMEAGIIESRTRFEAHGPLFRQDIGPREAAELRQVVPDQVRLIPLRRSDAIVRTGDAAVPMIILESDSQILHLLGPAMPGHVDACADEALIPADGAATRNGLEIGQVVRVGDRTMAIAGRFARQSIQPLPDMMRVDAIVCGPGDRAALENVDRYLAIWPAKLGKELLRNRLDDIHAQDGLFEDTWALLPVESEASLAARHRAKWLAAIQGLLLALSTALAILAGLMRSLHSGGDAWLRRALGQTARHRLSNAMRRFGAMSAIGCSIALVGTGLAVFAQARLFRGSPAMPSETAIIPALVVATLSTIAVAVVTIVTELLGHRWTAAAATTPRSSRRQGAIFACSGLAALIAAAICVPSVFLGMEMVRHARISPGYDPSDLHAARLDLVGHDGRSQQAWWTLLRALVDDVETIPGVLSAGLIEPAPWDYEGTQDVIEGDEHMLLNVAVSEGTLPMLRPESWKGRDVYDVENSLEYILQDVDEKERRSFLPKAATVVGELTRVRFSPLDENGRAATFRSLRTGIGDRVTIIIRSADRNALHTAGKRLSRMPDIVAGPLRSVSDILAARTAPVRAGAYVAIVMAALTVVLLIGVLAAGIRLHTEMSKKDAAIRMCIGAAPGRLALRLAAIGTASIASGWFIGSLAGLVTWREIVATLTEQRLMQPMSAVWLGLIALAVSGAGFYALARRRTGTIQLTALLADR